MLKLAPIELQESSALSKGWDDARSWYSEDGQSLHVHLRASRKSMVLGTVPNTVPDAPRVTTRMVGRYRWKAQIVR